LYQWLLSLAFRSDREDLSHLIERNDSRMDAYNNYDPDAEDIRAAFEKSALPWKIPRWVPDNIRPWCYVCHSTFHLFLRRHHCRMCGEVICYHCSPDKELLVEFIPEDRTNIPTDGHGYSYSDPLRICITCKRWRDDRKDQKQNNTVLLKAEKKPSTPKLLEKEPEVAPEVVPPKPEEPKVDPVALRRDQENQSVVTIQKFTRGFLARRKFRKAVNQVILLQVAIRTQQAQNYLSKQRQAIIALQTAVRISQAVKIITTIHAKASQKEKVAKELFETEKSYLEHLTLVQEVYLDPLLSGHNDIPRENIHLIFMNIPLIIQFHTHFLMLLDERINHNWKPHQILSDLFLEALHLFRDYYTPYIKGYDKSVEVYNKLLASSEPFAAFVEAAKQNPKCNKKDLPDLMITVVQRLPRYEMLLSQLAKYTDPATEEKKLLEEALAQVRQAISFVNEQKKESDSLTRMLSIQDKSKSKEKFQVYQPGRILLQEGLITQLDIKNHIFSKEKQVYLFVFNDMIMITKKTFKKQEKKTRPVEKPTKRLSADAPETLRYSHQIHIPLKDTVLVQHPGKDNENAEVPISISEEISDQDRCFCNM